MKIKNVICFEIEKGENLYRLEMPMGAPLGEAYDSVSIFQAKMVDLINEHAEKQKPKQEPKAEKEVEVVEVKE